MHYGNAGNYELNMLQHKKNLVCVPSPYPARLAPVLNPALGMAIVQVPINAALMAVGMIARNQWVCTLTINIPALKLGVTPVVIRMRNLLACLLLIFLCYALWALLLCKTGKFVLV